MRFFPLFLAAIVTSAAAAAPCFAQQTLEYGAGTNPTGSPIGGGPLYAHIVSRATATAVVSNATELLAALATAGPGAVVYVDDAAEIDLTGHGSIAIPENVTLASGRGNSGSQGALLFTTDASGYGQLFIPRADSRVTGLRLRGPDPEVGDHGYGQTDREPGAQGCLMSGMWVGSPRVLVDNCEISAWSNSGVALSGDSKDATVSHCYIHHCRRIGMGYGACVGGQTFSYIIGNVFEACRHDVASSGFIGSSYVAAYNVALPNQQGSVFDRHGTVDPGSWVGGDAGNFTIVHHNTVRALGVRGVGVRGLPAEIHGCQVYNNWFYHDDPDDAIWFWGNVSETDRVLVYDNVFTATPPPGSKDPVVRISSSKLFGRVPFTATFDSAGSHSPLGTALLNYRWRFGDSVGTEVFEVRDQSTATHTFTTAGVYTVSLTASDSIGIPETATTTVTAIASSGGPYWLSLWTKDSYRGARTGFYSTWIFAEGNALWHEDVAGDKGWQHVLVDVSSIVGTRTTVTVSFELHADAAMTDPDTEIVDMFAYLDDVKLFGTQGAPDDFEAGTGGWKFYEIGATTWSGTLWTGDSHGGLFSFWLQHGYQVLSTAGSRALINKTFEVVPKSILGQWDLEDETGFYALDSSPWSHFCELVNMDAVSSWTTAGIKGGALLFDGLNSHLDCGPTSEFQSSVGSLRLWIKQTSAKQATLFSACNNAETSCLTVSIAASGTVSASIPGGLSITTTQSLSAGVWHQVAVVQDGSEARVFADGERLTVSGSNSGQWTHTISATGVQIGGMTGSFFNGVIDEILFTSAVLSEAELHEEYRGMFPLGVWHFDEGEGDAIFDASSTNLTGTRVNSNSSSWIQGISGTAIEYAGGTVEIPDPGKKLLCNGPVSVELWLRFGSFGENELLVDNGFFRVYHRGGWAGDALYFLVRLENVGGATAPAAGDSAWDGWAGVKAVTACKAGEWLHFIGTRSGTTLRAFVNGKLERSSTCLIGSSVAQPNMTSTLRIGRLFDGAIDELTVYGRALTEGEAKAFYRRFLPADAKSSSGPEETTSGDSDDNINAAPQKTAAAAAIVAVFILSALLV